MYSRKNESISWPMRWDATTMDIDGHGPSPKILMRLDKQSTKGITGFQEDPPTRDFSAVVKDQTFFMTYGESINNAKTEGLRVMSWAIR
jgi:hypothetical protein